MLPSILRPFDRFGVHLALRNGPSTFKAGFLSSVYSVYDGRRSKFKSVARTESGDPDVFGDIGVDDSGLFPLKAESSPDDEDGYDKLEINRDRRHILFYKYKLTSLIHGQGKAKIVEALKLFDEMKKTDRKKVRPYMYTLLISGAAENGYTEKAFELFNEALKHKLKPTAATFTALFNACAECPFKEMGLEKATWLRRWVTDIGMPVTQLHYHAMLKAFGKLGDLKTAYELADEMASKDISIDTVTFNHLLMAAISQRAIGFGEAIKLFRRMRFHRVSRNLQTYNLMLKATKDCGIGEKEAFRKLVYEWLNMEKIVYRETRYNCKQIGYSKKTLMDPKISFESDKIYEVLPNGDVKFLETEEIEALREINSKKIQKTESDTPMQISPNFLVSSKFSSLSNLIDINYDSLSSCENRFSLIGGVEGMLHLLKSERIKPDIKTFALMLDVLPMNEQAEDQLVDCLTRSGIKPDTRLFNQIIRRRCFRKDLAAAKRALVEMQKSQVPIDLATFGVLALGCRNVKVANQLLKDMDEAGLKPNIQIMGAMMKKACLAKDIQTMKLVMEKMTEFSIPADRRLIDGVILTFDEIDKILWSIEKGKQKPFGHFLDPDFVENYSNLKSFFKRWSAKTKIDIHHPWDQFKYPRGDWQYHKMSQYEKEMRERIAQRPDLQEVANSGVKVNVHKLVHDF